MPVPNPPSLIWKIVNGLFGVDTPVQQDSSYLLTPTDRAYIDSQALGVETHLVQSLINGAHCTWRILDPTSASVQAGQVVCLAGMQSGTVTVATSGALAAAGSAFGVVVVGAGAGQPVLICRGGELLAAITGLSGAGGLYVTVTGSGALTPSSSLPTSGYVIGTQDAVGNLNVFPYLPATSTAATVTVGAITTIHRVSNAGLTFADTTWLGECWLRGLTATQTVNLDASPTLGMRRTIKDEDGSLASWNIIVNGNGHNIDGASSYTMTGALLGPYSSLTVSWNGVTWGSVG